MVKDKELHKFLTRYVEWLDSGKERHMEFSKDRGLCLSAYLYGGNDLTVKLEKEFYKDGLNKVLPFNDNTSDYTYEVYERIIHENTKRTAWARSKIGAPQGNNP